MLPDLIISLPRNVPLPQYRLFQRIRFYSELLGEGETGTGLVVGWSYVTSAASADNPRRGFHPRWQYVIQFDPDYLFGTVGEPQIIEESDILEIVEL